MRFEGDGAIAVVGAIAPSRVGNALKPYLKPHIDVLRSKTYQVASNP
ncbi:MAG: hypothetical protein AAFX40_11090 [Cyanobacteria bacterium J06639_1]